jgi:hypothetical protein
MNQDSSESYPVNASHSHALSQFALSHAPLTARTDVPTVTLPQPGTLLLLPHRCCLLLILGVLVGPPCR